MHLGWNFSVKSFAMCTHRAESTGMCKDCLSNHGGFVTTAAILLPCQTKKIKYFTFTDWCPFVFHIKPTSRYWVKNSRFTLYSSLVEGFFAFYIGRWSLGICPLSHCQHFLKVLLKSAHNLLSYFAHNQTNTGHHVTSLLLQVITRVNWLKEVWAIFTYFCNEKWNSTTKARFSRLYFHLSFLILIMTYDYIISQNIQMCVITTPKHMLTKQRPTHLSCSQKKRVLPYTLHTKFPTKRGDQEVCLFTAILPLYVSMCVWIVFRCLFIMLRW